MMQSSRARRARDCLRMPAGRAKGEMEHGRVRPHAVTYRHVCLARKACSVSCFVVRSFCAPVAGA